MRFACSGFFVVVLAGLSPLAATRAAFGQQSNPPLPACGTLVADSSALPDEPQPQDPVGVTEKDPDTTERAVNKAVPPSKQQPKRILGIMPNYRAVSAGAIPPPPTAREAFKIATQNSFDYSSFMFTGLTSMIAEGQDEHPSLGKGVPGFWGYSWRGFVDKTDGNYWVIFVLPTVFHQDERYFAKGYGSIGRRALYASSRVLVTPNYAGHNSFNTSELLGRAIAQGISISYYPAADHTPGDVAEKWAYSIMRDAATNAFREFWPDIATHVLHMHPASQ
jgi:hypothetical protein